LSRDRVVDLWSTHPTLIKLRQQIPIGLEGICGKYIFRDRCIGMCVAENYSYYGSLTSPYWFCQAAFDAGIFPSFRLRKIN